MRRPDLHALKGGAADGSSAEDVLVSYQKALLVLTARLSPFIEAHRIELALLEAVPKKQRRRLEARGR